jgi:hypothetical protein
VQFLKNSWDTIIINTRYAQQPVTQANSENSFASGFANKQRSEPNRTQLIQSYISCALQWCNIKGKIKSALSTPCFTNKYLNGMVSA